MPLKLKSAYLRNFGSVVESKVEFPDSGFVYVTGQNLTGSRKFESIGSGKTLLGLAISKALFGVTGHFKTPRKYSRDKKGNTLVVVEAELDGKPLKVEMGYQCKELSKSGEGLRYTLGDGEPVMFGSIDKTREELSKILRVKQSSAEWTVYVDGDAVKFNSLSESKAVSLLMDTLDQPPWDKYKVNVDRAAKRFGTQLSESEGSLATTRQLLTSAAASVTAYETTLSSESAAHSLAVTQWQARMDAFDVQLAGFGARKIDLFVQLNQVKKKIREAEAAEAGAYAAVQQELLSATSKHAALNRSLIKAGEELLAANKALSKVKSDFKDAKANYTADKRNEANVARTAALKEETRINRLNSQAERQYDAEKNRLGTALTAANTAVERAQNKLANATRVWTAEVEAPHACPLAGCGKAWPKTNQKQEAAALLDKTTAEAELAAANVKVAEAELAHTNFISVPAVILPIPAIPAEVTADFELPNLKEWEMAVVSEELRISALENEQASLQKDVETAQTDIDDKTAKSQQLTLASKVVGLSVQAEEIETAANKVQAELDEVLANKNADVQPSQARLEAAKTRLEEAVKQKEKLEAELQETTSLVSECRETLAVANYWSSAFSPTGIPNLVIKESIAPLNLSSKKLSSQITGGQLEVVYETSRVLQDGREKNEISIIVKNPFGSSDADINSKGESGLLNFIVSETLAEVGMISHRVGYRWLDEIATTQDQQVRRSIFGYVQQRTKDLGILTFVVDHSLEVANYADHVLVAVKDQNGTTYHWEN